MDNPKLTDKTLLKEFASSFGYTVTNISTVSGKNLLSISNGTKFYLANSGEYGYYPNNQRWHTALFKDKIQSSIVLRKLGYPCLKSYDFSIKNQDLDSILTNLNKLQIDFPVILKPSQGMRGRGIKYLNNSIQLTEAATIQYEKKSDFCIQPIVNSNEYRILFLNGQASVLHSKNFNYIKGDGEQTITSLLNTTTIPNGCLDDEYMKDELVKRNLDYTSVLEKGVTLNTHLTSTTVDKLHNEIYFTNDIPKATSVWAKKLAQDLSASTIGIDIFANDIQNVKTYQIIEINSNPGFDYIVNKFEGYKHMKDIWRKILSSFFSD